MRKLILLAITFIAVLTSVAQDFSNKGKDFWVGYGYHTQMQPANGNSQDMVLYFATDQVTNIVINIPATGYTQNITTAAGNNVTTSVVIPKTGAQDARLLNGGLSNNGIHITSDKPMVAYAHIYNGSCSGATILYPTNTLGREYYSVNYKNWSNQNNANGWFYVMAVDTGTTTIEITPQADQGGIVTTPASGSWIAGTTYTINLTQGQIYNVMGILTTFNNPFKGVDLTGSKIKSINNGTGCKKIAVYSGTGRISITCNAGSSSSDNYMVQAMPRNAWGKKYLTVPANGNQANNIYRVCVSSPAAVVKINGLVTALPLINNFYYEMPATNQPQLIESDSAIMVAQYFTSQGACGNGAQPGDPEVIYLSAVEQNINKVLWNATGNFAISTHSFNVVLPNTGTAVSSFRLDGGTVGGWITHPQDPNFVYLRLNVSQGFHVIQSDSGFNAIAYGFGNAESYGYNAGTNIRDLYQQIGVRTTYGIETTPSVCTNSPFKFKVSLPYIPDSMRWNFNGAIGMLPNNNSVFVDNTGNIAEDSTTVVNGRTIHWYSIPLQYTFTAIGTYPITITTYVPNGECGAQQDIDFDLQVSDPPTASFTVALPGCYTDPVTATETTPQVPKATYKIWWEFYDPVTNTATVYQTTPSNAYRTVTHTFTTPGVKTIRHASITTPGCLSDTIVQTIDLPDLPNATISANATVCINTSPGPPITFTGSLGTQEYIFSYTIDNGSGPGPVQFTPPSTSGSFTFNAPTNVAGTFIYNLVGVSNALPAGTACTRTITGQSVTVNITPDATITLTSAAGTDNQTVCINNPITNITYAVGGSGNGASVVFTPALPGVTGVYAGGVFTISGTPTLNGVFSYTVSTTGPCVTPTINGTITVTPDGTINLTSAAGTDNQTICINTPLVNITYAVAGSTTGGTVSGLPAGVTGVYSAGVITISGTPTVSGTFNYTVTTTGPCINPTATGTITVTADGTITLTSAAGTDNQSLCINVPITNITYAVGGSGTGGSVTGLPPGVTGVFAGGVITISGTPTAIGTYNYTVTTTGPCVTPQATGVITVNPDASITLTSAPPTENQELCRNSTLTNITYAIAGGGTGAGVTGLPAGVTGVFAGGVFTISGTPTVAGVFNYTVTTTGTCVQNSESGTITVNQLPTPAFTYTTPSCETRTIDFTDASVPNSGALATWSWNFGDPGSGPNNTSNLQNPSHTFATAGTYTVTLTVTTDKGCVSDPISSVPITINLRPEAGFIVPEVCINDVATPFIDTSKIAAPGTINRALNEWNYGDPGSGPNNTSVGQNGLHLYTATGVYQVTQIVTSADGCRDTIVLPITINAADPVSSFLINNQGTLCSSDSVSLVNRSTVSFGNVTRLDIYWDNIGAPGTFETINTPVFNEIYKHKYPTSPVSRNYQIRMIAYSGTICFTQSTLTITVHANPVVQLNDFPDACLLVAPYLLTQGSEIGGVPGTFAYSGPGIINPNGTFAPQVAGIGLHAIKYTFTASNPGGCIDTLTKFIRVLDTAHADFSFVSPSCELLPTSFTDLSTAPATVVLANTVWDFGDGSPNENHAPGSTFGHTFPAPGTYTVTMYNVSAYGCNSTAVTHQVTVDANHTITLASGSDNQTVCINTPIVNIVYTLAGGATGATVTGLPTGVTANVTGNTLTISGTPNSNVGGPTFTYTVLTTGNSCLIADTTGTITVDPDHTIALTSGNPTQSVCVNSPIDPIIYTIGGGANNVTINNLPPGIVYNVVGTTLTISGTPTSIAGGPVFAYSIQTTGNACVVATALGEIKVNPYPVPNFAMDKPSYCIPNAIVSFNNLSTMPDGSGMTYVWDFGEPSSPNNSSTAVNPSHWYSGIGPFNVTLRVRSTAVLNGNVIGCEHDTMIQVTTIHPQPKADFVFNKPAVCIGDNVTITDNTDGKDGIVNQWNWDLGDGTTRTINPVTHTYGDTINYNITLYTINSHGCNSDTITKTFSVNAYPHVNAGPDRFVLEGGSIMLETVTYAVDAQYTWTPNLYLSDATIARPRVVDPKTDMTYRLTVTAKGGCALSDDVFVKLLKFPVIPNTFTPNGDGINDTWRIDFLNTYPNNRVQIFTRTGKLVFESRGYDTPWDGTMKGKPMPFDTYYYIIEPGNGRDPLTGYVTIIK